MPGDFRRVYAARIRHSFEQNFAQSRELQKTVAHSPQEYSCWNFARLRFVSTRSFVPLRNFSIGSLLGGKVSKNFLLRQLSRSFLSLFLQQPSCPRSFNILLRTATRMSLPACKPFCPDRNFLPAVAKTNPSPERFPSRIFSLFAFTKNNEPTKTLAKLKVYAVRHRILQEGLGAFNV